jgi:hypothetical protein
MPNKTPDRAWADYEKSFRTVGLRQIMESAVTMMLYSGDGSDFDVKQATELGAMLLLDKPIILLGAKGAVLPSRLVKAADVVIADWGPDNHDAQARLTEAVLKLSAEVDGR